MNFETEEVPSISFELEVVLWANTFLLLAPNASFDLLLRRVRPLYGWRLPYLQQLVIERWLALNPQVPA